MTNGNDGRCLLLWDIDHTLIETRGVGKQLYAAAFEAVTRRQMEHAVEPTGRTELAIFAETLQRHGIEASEELQHRYAVELARQYAEHADQLRAKGRALPGARDVLSALAQQPDTVQTVLTGNIRAAGMTKLRVFGLDEHIDFEVGAYGEDDAERAKLVAVAQKRAADKYGAVFDRPNTLVIGDTKQDVIAAHRGGARIIAVASGRDNADDLREAGADAVLADLIDTRRTVAAVRATCRSRSSG